MYLWNLFCEYVFVGWKITGKACCSPTDWSSIPWYLIRPDWKRQTFLSKLSTIVWSIWFQHLSWWRLCSCCCRVTVFSWCRHNATGSTKYVCLYDILNKSQHATDGPVWQWQHAWPSDSCRLTVNNTCKYWHAFVKFF